MVKQHLRAARGDRGDRTPSSGRGHRLTSRSVIAALALGIGVVGIAAPAGAAQLKPWVTSPSVGSAPTHIVDHSVAPLNRAIIETASADDPTDFPKVTNAHVTAASFQKGASGANDTLSVTWTGGVTLTVSAPNLHAGQNLDNADVEVTGCDTSLLGDAGAVVIDQLSVTGSTVNTLGIKAVALCVSATSLSAIEAIVAFNLSPTTAHQGYYLFGADGELQGFGNDGYLNYLGDLSAVALNQPVVGMATTTDDAGYWMVAKDGGVFNFGDAGYHGSTGGMHLNKPIVGMAATADGNGYWLVASDGGIFSFGDAHFYGSTGAMHLNKPIVGMATTKDGKGYWLVASDGGIFTFGDARFHGSAGSLPLNKPVVGMARTPDGAGYWLVASDGGIFTYGDARFHGSAGNLPLTKPIEGMTPSADGNGYWFVASDGGVFSYGDAKFKGSLGGQGLEDIAGMAQ